MDNSVTAEMPRYKCHKTVRAVKIGAVTENVDGSRTLVPTDEDFAAFDVNVEYVRKHDPIPGGYFVAYEDGYLSFSPGEVFEAGYTRID